MQKNFLLKKLKGIIRIPKLIQSLSPIIHKMLRIYTVSLINVTHWRLGIYTGTIIK